jgi:hypothetical protein
VKLDVDVATSLISFLTDITFTCVAVIQRMLKNYYVDILGAMQISIGTMNLYDILNYRTPVILKKKNMNILHLIVIDSLKYHI